MNLHSLSILLLMNNIRELIFEIKLLCERSGLLHELFRDWITLGRNRGVKLRPRNEWFLHYDKQEFKTQITNTNSLFDIYTHLSFRLTTWIIPKPCCKLSIEWSDFIYNTRMLNTILKDKTPLSFVISNSWMCFMNSDSVSIDQKIIKR